VHACAVCLRAAVTALPPASVDAAAMAPLLCAGKHSKLITSISVSKYAVMC
jgi:hypothetical protein